MSQYTSLVQVETAIAEGERTLAAAETPGASSDAGPAAAGDGEALGYGMAAAFGVGVQLLSEVTQAMAGSSPADARSGQSAGAARFKTDVFTGRKVKADQSNFFGVTTPANQARHQPRDIMAAPGTPARGDSRFAGKQARKKPGMPQTEKGHDLDEAVALTGMSLNSPTRGLRANLNTGVSHAALRAQLESLRELADKPTEQMARNDLDNPYLTASRFAMPEAAQQRIELTAGIAPQPKVMPTPPMPAPGMGSRG